MDSPSVSPQTADASSFPASDRHRRFSIMQLRENLTSLQSRPAFRPDGAENPLTVSSLYWQPDQATQVPVPSESQNDDLKNFIIH
jgi:hypothetical protein